MGCRSSKNREPGRDVNQGLSQQQPSVSPGSNTPDSEPNSPATPASPGQASPAKSETSITSAKETTFPSSGDGTYEEILKRAIEDGISEATLKMHQAEHIRKSSIVKRASVAKGLGISDITWDAELVNENPLDGLAKFLVSHRFRMTDLFKQLDKDKDGQLNFDDFERGMMDLGMPVVGNQTAILKCLFDEIDQDGDGKLSYLEFTSVRNRGRRNSMSPQSKTSADPLSQSRDTSPQRSTTIGSLRKSVTGEPVSPTRSISIKSDSASPERAFAATDTTLTPPSEETLSSSKRSPSISTKSPTTSFSASGAGDSALTDYPETPSSASKQKGSPSRMKLQERSDEINPIFASRSPSSRVVTPAGGIPLGGTADRRSPARSPRAKRTHQMSEAAAQHQARQKYIQSVMEQKKLSSKRRPSQDVGPQLPVYMASARRANLAPVGNKRVHPFLDAGGVHSHKNRYPVIHEPKTMQTDDGTYHTVGL